jgi:tRNA-5-methyluridine54 2-sulfurtransferase
MKCRVCGQVASIRLKAYNTALCEGDFLSFLEKRVSSTIEKYRLIGDEDRPVVAVSGGKDSLSLWYMLSRLGFNADGVYIDLGIEDYSRVSLEKTRVMADTLRRRLYIFHVPDVFQKGIYELSRAIRRAPCSACGMVKRYVMNRVCLDHGFTVLVTGHNLDDEAAALLGNLLYWKEEYLWKKNVALEGLEGHLSRKVKPLFLCSEREVAAYAVLSKIDYIYDECPFSVHAKSLTYKDILNRLEESSPGTKIQFVKGYLKRVRETSLPRAGGYCASCGYPSFGQICSVCKLLERFHLDTNAGFESYSPGNLDTRQGIVT